MSEVFDVGPMVFQEDYPEEMLLDLSSQPDLESITTLELAVDAEESSVSQLGAKVPNLEMLRASGSNLAALRDLGSTFGSLRVLWLNHSNVNTCAGVTLLPLLEELYLSFNHIDELSWLAGHEHLRVLDLESNCVAHMGQVELLSQCTELRSLNLEDNPVAEAAGYKSVVAKAIPELEFLDDEEAAPFRDVTSPEPEGAAGEEVEAEVAASTPERLPQGDTKVLTPARWQDGIEEILKDMRREISTRHQEETAGLTDKILAAREKRLVTESIRNGVATQAAGRQRSGYTRPGSARGPRPSSSMGRINTLTNRPATASGVRSAMGRASWPVPGRQSLAAETGDCADTSATDEVSAAVLNRSTKEELLEQLTAPVVPSGGGADKVLSPDRPAASASALTHHTSSVFCGNLTRSLRTRRLDEE